ncbi:hypothetical protein ACFX16_012962 [Malus domestica]
MLIQRSAEFVIVELGDKGVNVKLVEEFGTIFSAQPITYYLILTKKFHVLAGIYEIIHQNSIRCYVKWTIVIALFKGNEVLNNGSVNSPVISCGLVKTPSWN